MILIFKIINRFIRLQIEVVFFTSVVGFTIVAVYRFDDDNVRHGRKNIKKIIRYKWMKQYKQIIK